MQVAIAEARNLVDAGNRVAFFASSTGEVERIADILNEYTIPYQLGIDQTDSTPAYLAERAYMAGTVASIFLVKGNVRHGTTFKESQLVVFGSEDLFETSELVSRGPTSKSAMETFSADIIDLKPGDFVVHAEHEHRRVVFRRCGQDDFLRARGEVLLGRGLVEEKAGEAQLTHVVLGTLRKVDLPYGRSRVHQVNRHGLRAGAFLPGLY